MTGQRTVQWHRVRMLNSPGVSGPLGREFCVLEPPAGGVLRAGADGRLDHVACWRPQSDKLPHHGRLGRVPMGLRRPAVMHGCGLRGSSGMMTLAPDALTGRSLRSPAYARTA